MEQFGEVISVSGNSLTVLVKRHEACEKCGACFGGRKKQQLTVKGHAAPGDQVVLNMPSGNVLKACALAYLIPLAGLIAGLLLGILFAANQPANDFYALIGGLLGLSLSLVLVRLADKRIRNEAAWHPQVVRVIHAKQEEIAHE